MKNHIRGNYIILGLLAAVIIGCTKSPGKIVQKSYTEILEEGNADFAYENMLPSDKVFSKEKISALVEENFKSKKAKGISYKNVEVAEEKVEDDVAKVKLKYIEVNEKTKKETEQFQTINAVKIDDKWYVILK